MHTTASDGRLTPVELVARAAAAGLTTISVTDHDTVAAIAEVTAAAQPPASASSPASRSPPIDDGRDVHMLGYLFDKDSAQLSELLVSQRALRVIARARDCGAAGIAQPVRGRRAGPDLPPRPRPGSSVGRPQLARELVRAGARRSRCRRRSTCGSATGRPAFVPRTGPSPAAVIDDDSCGRRRRVVRASRRDQARRSDRAADRSRARCDRGVSLGSLRRGRDGVSGHDDPVQRADLSGGSDFHGEDPGRPGRPHRATFGAITLPPDAFAALEEKARSRKLACARLGGTG